MGKTNLAELLGGAGSPNRLSVDATMFFAALWRGMRDLPWLCTTTQSGKHCLAQATAISFSLIMLVSADLNFINYSREWRSPPTPLEINSQQSIESVTHFLRRFR